MIVEDRQRLLRDANHELAAASEAWTEARAGGKLPNPHDERLSVAEKRSRNAQNNLDSALRKAGLATV